MRMPAAVRAENDESVQAEPSAHGWSRSAAFVKVLGALRDSGNDPFADVDPRDDAGFYGPVLTEDDVFGRPPDGTGPAALTQDASGYGVIAAPESNPEPENEPEPSYHEGDITWFVPPPNLDGLVWFGAVHTDDQCPLFLFRVLDDQVGWVELAGSPEGMEELGEWIKTVTSRFLCMANGLKGPQPVRGPVIQAMGGPHDGDA